MTIPGISLRPAVESDLHFIMSSWLSSYLDRDNGAVEIKRVRDSVAKAGHRQLVARLLAAPETATLVACARESPNTIVGWACLRLMEFPRPNLPHSSPPSALHYVYVKADFRKAGIARMLVEANFDPRVGLFSDAGAICALRFSHYTRAVDEWRAKWEPRGVEFVFDPYAALVTQ